MQDDLPGDLSRSDFLSNAEIEEIIRELAAGYSKKLADEDLSEHESRLLTVFCLDLVNLLHLIHGDLDAVIANQEKYGAISGIQVKPLAAYQEEQADKEAEKLAQDPDPLKWN